MQGSCLEVGGHFYPPGSGGYSHHVGMCTESLASLMYKEPGNVRV